MTDTTSTDLVAADDQPAIFGIPFNRIVTFAGPHISWLSGVIATWLLVHVHFLSLFHFQQDGLATGIAQGVVFVLVTAVTWLGHQKWIEGHHIELAGANGLILSHQADDLNGPAQLPPGGDYDASQFENKPTPDIDRSGA